MSTGQGKRKFSNLAQIRCTIHLDVDAKLT